MNAQLLVFYARRFDAGRVRERLLSLQRRGNDHRVGG